MTGGAVADGEARGLVTNQLKHQLIFITHIRNILRDNQKPLYYQDKIFVKKNYQGKILPSSARKVLPLDSKIGLVFISRYWQFRNFLTFSLKKLTGKFCK
jgi:hypothetical protein